eukprot:930439-Pleurochrysis_carterae.AAC.1
MPLALLEWRAAARPASSRGPRASVEVLAQPHRQRVGPLALRAALRVRRQQPAHRRLEQGARHRERRATQPTPQVLLDVAAADARAQLQDGLILELELGGEPVKLLVQLSQLVPERFLKHGARALALTALKFVKSA